MLEIDMDRGWSDIPLSSGLTGKLLSGDFDEAKGRGHRTRVVRFGKGARTTEPFTDAYWEEVYLVSGELTTSADGETLCAPAYVIRPPGTPHGPFHSDLGCLLLEVQYFSERSLGDPAFLDPNAPRA